MHLDGAWRRCILVKVQWWGRRFGEAQVVVVEMVLMVEPCCTRHQHHGGGGQQEAPSGDMFHHCTIHYSYHHTHLRKQAHQSNQSQKPKMQLYLEGIPTNDLYPGEF